MGSGAGRSRRARSSAGSGPPNDKRGWTLEQIYGDGHDAVTVRSRVLNGATIHQLLRSDGAYLLDAVRGRDGSRQVVCPGIWYASADMATHQDTFADALSGALETWRLREDQDTSLIGGRRDSAELFRSVSGDPMACRVTNDGVCVEIVAQWDHDDGGVEVPESIEDITDTKEVDAYTAGVATSILKILGGVEEREARMEEMKNRVLRVAPGSVGRVGF